MDAVKKAQEAGQNRARLESDCDEYGIFVVNEDLAQELLRRVRENWQLADALRYAKESGVQICAYDKFNAGASLIFIDIQASDTEIIKFLSVD